MNRRIVIGLCVLLTALVVGYFVRAYDPEEVEREVGLRGEARLNEWLAAERILRRMGVRTERLHPDQWRDAMPGTGGALMLKASGEEIADTRRDALHQWIADGGHLITAVNRTRKCQDEESAHWLDDFLSGFISSTTCDAAPGTGDVELDVRLPGAALSVAIARRVRVRMQASALGRVMARDEHGDCFVQGQYGQGTITVLCDETLFENLGMADDDRAELLVRLVSQPGYFGDSNAMAGGLRVWLDHWGPRLDSRASLPEWIWQRAPVTVLLSALALALALWAAVRRLGPRIGLPDTARRELMEHVDACGRFAWRQKAEGKLLQSLRESLDEALARRVPGWRTLDLAHRIERLTELTGMDPDRIQTALDPPTDARALRKQFAPLVYTLERLRRKL